MQLTTTFKSLGMATLLGMVAFASPASAQQHNHNHNRRPVTLVTVTRSLDVAAIRLSDDIAEQGDNVRHFQVAAQEFTDAAEHLRLSVLQNVGQHHLMKEYHEVVRLYRFLGEELEEHGSTPMIDRDMKVVGHQIRILSDFFPVGRPGPGGPGGPGFGQGQGQFQGQGPGIGKAPAPGHDDHDDHDHVQGKGPQQGPQQGPGKPNGVGLQLGKVKVFIKNP